MHRNARPRQPAHGELEAALTHRAKRLRQGHGPFERTRAKAVRAHALKALGKHQALRSTTRVAVSHFANRCGDDQGLRRIRQRARGDARQLRAPHLGRQSQRFERPGAARARPPTGPGRPGPTCRPTQARRNRWPRRAPPPASHPRQRPRRWPQQHAHAPPRWRSASMRTSGAADPLPAGPHRRGNRTSSRPPRWHQEPHTRTPRRRRRRAPSHPAGHIHSAASHCLALHMLQARRRRHHVRRFAALRERRLADRLHAVGKGIALLIGRGAEQKHSSRPRKAGCRPALDNARSPCSPNRCGARAAA